MSINFYKYQGTGNDFIICLDEEFNDNLRQNKEYISKLCDRKFGIGADGLIVIQKKENSDFYMHYFNSDGKPSSLCGNGSRCAVAHAYFLGWVKEDCIFEAADGMHRAQIIQNKDMTVKINMTNVYNINAGLNTYILDTGSPHYVTFVNHLEHIDIKESGKKIRNSDKFILQGINVNFVQEHADKLEICTYERGVEDETLSCGTGATAAALAHAYRNKLKGSNKIIVHTKGGPLTIEYDRAEDLFCNIWLSGPAIQVFKGQIEV